MSKGLGLEQQLQRAKLRLRDVSEERDELQQLVADIRKDADSQITRLKSENTKLIRQNQALTEAQGESQELRQQIQELQSEIGRLDDLRFATEAQLQELESLNSLLKHSAQDRLLQLEQENANIKQTTEEPVQRLQQEISELGADLSQLQEEHAAVNVKLKQAESDGAARLVDLQAEMAILTAALEQSEQEKDSLKEEVNNACTAPNDTENQITQLLFLETENARLSMTLQDAASNALEMEVAEQKASMKLELLEQENDRLKAMCVGDKQGALVKELDRMKQVNEGLQNQLEQAAQRVSMIRHAQQELESENKMLGAQLPCLRDENLHLAARLAEADRRLVDLPGLWDELSRLQQANLQLQRENSFQAQSLEVRHKVDAHEASKLATAGLHQTIRVLECENTALIDRIQHVEARCADSELKELHDTQAERAHTSGLPSATSLKDTTLHTMHLLRSKMDGVFAHEPVPHHQFENLVREHQPPPSGHEPSRHHSPLRHASPHEPRPISRPAPLPAVFDRHRSPPPRSPLPESGPMPSPLPQDPAHSARHFSPPRHEPSRHVSPPRTSCLTQLPSQQPSRFASNSDPTLHASTSARRFSPPHHEPPRNVSPPRTSSVTELPQSRFERTYSPERRYESARRSSSIQEHQESSDGVKPAFSPKQSERHRSSSPTQPPAIVENIRTASDAYSTSGYQRRS